MKPERSDAELIFGEALRLSKPAELKAYLARACVGNPQLRREVESLLSAHHRAGDFLGRARPLPIADLPERRPGHKQDRRRLE